MRPDPNAPLMKRTDLLRGSFVLVKHEGTGWKDTRLVLLSFTPENRKLVFSVHEDKRLGGWHLERVQDSLGMARDVKS